MVPIALSPPRVREPAVMELRHLRYSVAVAEELHFRRAADRLHVALTPAGAAMLEEARRVLRQADDAQRVAREAHARMLGRLRVGYVPDALPAAVPRRLRRFAAQVPGVDVTLEPGRALRLLQDVRDRRLDMAVVCLPAPIADLQAVRIARDTAVAAVPDGHPCAGEAEIALAGLENTRLVQLARDVNPAFYGGVLAACRTAGIAPALVEVDEPAVDRVLLSVACGAGIAVLPASAAAPFTAPGVRFAPLAEPAPVCEVAPVARAEPRTTTAALQRLLRHDEPAQPRPMALAELERSAGRAQARGGLAGPPRSSSGRAR